MHLYLLSQHIRKEIEVTLENGCEPCVSGYQHSAKDIEPAIWFKVMILDAITVDCDERRISWIPLCDGFSAVDSGIACDSYRLSEERGAVGRQYGCTDDAVYSRLDEVFETVPDLLTRYRNPDEAEAMTADDFNKQIMGLLHVHILPSVRLTVRDIESIKICIQAQEEASKHIDERILGIAEKQNRVVQSLANLRKSLLQELSMMEGKAALSTLPVEMIKILLEDVEKDVTDIWSKIERAQAAVEKAKEKRKEDRDLLKDQRAQRDAIRSEYEKMLSVREKLKEKLKTLKSAKTRIANRLIDALTLSQQPMPLHNMYLAMHKQIQDFSKQIEDLTSKKLLVISVKEAAHGALEDIQAGNDTFAIDMDCVGTARATDVLGGVVQSPWKSLAEQIAAVLSDSKDPITKLHTDFCNHITERCSAAIKEKNFFDASVRKSLKLSSDGHNCDSARSSTLSDAISPTEVEQSHWNPIGQCGSNRIFDSSSLQLESSQTPSVFANDEKDQNLTQSLPVYWQESVTDHILEATKSISECSNCTGDAAKGDRRSQISISSKKVLYSQSGSLSSSFRSYVPDLLMFSGTHDDSADVSVIVFDTKKDCLRMAVESIKKEINEHFQSISKELQSRFAAASGTSHFRQIWLDYEAHFYVQCLDSLTSLYNLHYKNATDTLRSSLRSLTPEDLSLEDAVLIHLLDDSSDDDEYDDQNAILGSCNRSLKVSRTSTLKSSQCNVDVLSREASASSCSTARNSDVLKSLPRTSRLPSDTESDDEAVRSVPRRIYSDNSKHPRFRTVRISLPVTMLSTETTLVYERTLSPLPPDIASHNNNNTDSTFFGAACSEKTARTMTLKPSYRQLFSSALNRIECAISAQTPAKKLRFLTDCLKETNGHICTFYRQLYGMPTGQSGCDELMDALVILLCNIDGQQLSLLYCQLMLLTDTMAPWLARGPFSFTLVQFVGACQFIQERLWLKSSRISLSRSASDA